MKAVFITGTDTEVGKTVVTGLLAKFLLDRGQKVITQKWIQTGCEDFPEDIASHLKLMGVAEETVAQYLPLMAPYVFKLPASPHLAAAVEKKQIDAGRIKDCFAKLAGLFDTVIVEGIGGALVPFSDKTLVIDIAADLHLPVIIVAKNKLGAVNHTLLTIEAITVRGMPIAGVVFNSDKNEKKIIADDNPEIIKSLTGRKILGTLPWVEKGELLAKAFRPIGEALFESAGDLRDG